MRHGAPNLLAKDNPIFIDKPYYPGRCTVFSPNGRYVAGSHDDGIVRVWDVRTGRLIRRLKADSYYVVGIAFMPDGKGLVSGGAEGILRSMDISSLNTTRSCAPSRMADGLHGHVPEVEGQAQPEREFSGHKVRSSFSFLLLFIQLPSFI
jgi:WD40 repeat protein